MNVKGKFYIWLNIASATRYYWDQSIQNFTSDWRKATLFETKKEAEAEAQHAAFNSEGEVIVVQATKNPVVA